MGSVDGGGGSNGQGQIRSAAGAGTKGRTPAFDSGGESSARVTARARILLKSDDGWAAPQVAEALDVALGTAYRIKQHFAEEGLERALRDRRQANRYRKLDDRGEAHLVAPRSWPGAGFGLQPSARGP